MSDRAKTAEAVRWHLSTIENAVEELKGRVAHRAIELPVQNRMALEDTAKLIGEHLEGLVFEYNRLCELEERNKNHS